MTSETVSANAGGRAAVEVVVSATVGLDGSGVVVVVEAPRVAADCGRSVEEVAAPDEGAAIAGRGPVKDDRGGDEGPPHAVATRGANKGPTAHR